MLVREIEGLKFHGKKIDGDRRELNSCLMIEEQG